MVKFPQDESGAQRKLSRPWHGPYRITSLDNPDVTVVKVYFPQDGTIQIHQLRVQPCLQDLPAGFYWYGGKRSGPGRPPKWVNKTKLQEPPQRQKRNKAKLKSAPRLKGRVNKKTPEDQPPPPAATDP